MNRTTSTIPSGADGRFAPIRTLPTWALLLSGGTILGLAFPPNFVGGLFAAIGLVPLIVALERSSDWRTDVKWSYLSFLIFSAVSTWWVGSWQANSDPWLSISSILLVLIHPLFFCIPIVLYTFVRRRRGLATGLVFLVLFWCGGEYLHALGELSYPWLTLGNAQTYNSLYIQFIEWTGVWGLSLLLLIQNGIIAWYVLTDGRREVPAGSGRLDRALPRVALPVLVASVVIPYALGIFLMPEVDLDQGETISVIVVQPNQNPWDKWRQDDTVDHILDNGSLTLDAIAAGDSADMVLWAENAIPYTITKPGPYSRNKGQLMEQMVQMIGVPVVTGFPDWVQHPTREAATPSSRRDSAFNEETGRMEEIYYDHFNSIGVFGTDGQLRDVYHKSQLVPFGERIPYIDAAPFLVDMLSWDVGISSWGKGSGPHALTLPADRPIRFAGMVCFESVYPNLVRQFVADGAEFLTIVTNDGWYLDTPGPLQHQRFAILRAVETRRSVARAANTGISCFIYPDGSIGKETEEGERTTITAEIPLATGETFYVTAGDWLPILCLIGALLILGAVIVQWWKARRKTTVGS